MNMSEWIKRIPLITVVAIVAIVSFLLWGNVFYSMIVTFVAIIIVSSEETWMDYLRMRSPMLLTDDGCRRSFRYCDKLTVSSPMKNDYDYVIYATGGSDFAWLPIRGGMLENPFIIVPREFIISTASGSAGEYASGNIHDKEWDELPKYFQDALERHPCTHFNKKYSKIKMIDVSYINLSDTNTNIDLAGQRDAWIATCNAQKKLINHLSDQISENYALRKKDEEGNGRKEIIYVPKE